MRSYSFSSSSSSSSMTPIIGAAAIACTLFFLLLLATLGQNEPSLAAMPVRTHAMRGTGMAAGAPLRLARQAPAGCRRRVIVRNEGLEQIPEPERPNEKTGYTARDSAGQSNIFATETRAYVGDTVSDNGILTGGYFLAAAAAAGAFIVPQLTYKEDFSTPKYSKMVEFENSFAKELGMQTKISAPAPPIDATPAEQS